MVAETMRLRLLIYALLIRTPPRPVCNLVRNFKVSLIKKKKIYFLTYRLNDAFKQPFIEIYTLAVNQ